jgi:hypothetical protein
MASPQQAALHVVKTGMELVQSSNIPTTIMALQIVARIARDEDLPEASKVEDIIRHLKAAIELAR